MAYIIWNPDGTLIDLTFYSLRWYSLLFGLGFPLSYIILQQYFKAENIKPELLPNLAFYVYLGTIIGARLGHCLFYDFDYYSQHITEIFLPVRFTPDFKFIGFQGLASHGGAAGIFTALVLFSRRYKVSLIWLLDKLTLVFPLASCLIRIGNLMNSEIVGKPTTVNWAFIFPQVDSLPRHPAQLYEALVYFILFIMLNMLALRANLKPGVLFGLSMVLLFASRFAIEFIKADQSDFEAGMLLNMGQLLSIPYILAGLLLIFIKNSSNKEQTLLNKL